jgi:hypothetical protein
MTKSKVYDADGNLLPEGSIVPDGGRTVTQVTLMDSAAALADGARHSPGGLAIGDTDLDAKAAALDARDARLSSAWKNPPSVETKAPVKDATIPVQPTADAIEAMHSRRHQRLEASWKGAAA